MARPQKNNADFFSHDSDMRNDPKIRALRRKWSHMGYAVWSFILEYLTDCDYFCVEWSDLNIELLAADFDVDPEELSNIVDYCVKLGLLHVKDGNLTCENLKERMKPLLDKRTKKIDPTPASDSLRSENDADKQFTERKLSKNGVSGVENAHSKVNNSKVNNSKVNISSGEEVRADISAQEKQRIFEIFLFEKRVNPQQELDKFANYYQSTGWINVKGQPITDKVALASIWRAEATIDAEQVSVWRSIYNACRGYPGQERLLTDFVKIVKNEGCVTVVLKSDNSMKTIELAAKDTERRKIIKEAVGGARLKYSVNQKHICG